MTSASSLHLIGLGESLLRLSTPGHERLERAGSLDVHVGGAEMNALIAGASVGHRATWVSRLADNPLGHTVATHAAAFGLRTHIDWDPDARAPLYFVEHGARPRPSEVLYDRSGTAMTTLTPTGFAWTDLVTGADATVSTGITCALGEGPAAAVAALFTAARGVGARTTFDVNHRSRLWSWERAAPVLRDLLPRVDVLFASHHDLQRLLDKPGDDEASGAALARRAIGEFGHEMVVLRDTSQPAPRTVATSVTAITPDDTVTSDTYEADVVDNFGAGDAALGVFLATWLTGEGLPTATDKGAWAAAFHHTVPGDAWQGRPAEPDHRDTRGRRILR